MTFYAGQKVLCIDAASRPGKWDREEALVRGQIYTVISAHLDHFGDPVLWLHEICRSGGSIASFGPLAGYGQYRFRPLCDRRTDISIFRKLLTPTPSVMEPST